MAGSRYTAANDGAAVVLADHDGGASARIEPARGATVSSFDTRVAGRQVSVLSPRGIPILFPFPNRIPHGRFVWRRREYQMNVNERGRPNHNHGLVRDRPWRLEALGATADGAAATMTLDLGAIPDAMRQYPFPCQIGVTAALSEGALRHDVTVRNVGTEDMPMGYGIHPWFPPAMGGERGATEVRIPAGRRWELIDKVPTGRVIALEDEFDLRGWRAVGDHEYDDVFTAIDRRSDGWSDAAVRYDAAGVEVLVEASREFREWVLFADPTRDAIAIEPYSCVTNAVNLEARGIDAGLIVLAPGESWTASVRITARPVASPSGLGM